jgi:dTDP-4-dehydrorhamnose reductase
MKVILLGSGGFLGSHIYKDLIDLGHEMSTLSYQPKDDFEFTSQLVKVVKSVNPDIIINASGSKIQNDDPEALHELSFLNILLPSYLAWAINNYVPKCILITFGSSWQYCDINPCLLMLMQQQKLLVKLC